MSEKRRNFTTPLILGAAILGGLFIVMRLFIFDLHRLPASSMSPALNHGDFVVTSRRAYVRRDPQPGEIVVFKRKDGVNFIKRVAGLPGQTVVYRDKRLYIDGTAMTAEAPADQPAPYLVEETLGDYQYQALLNPARKAKEGEYPVPEGHYFMLGDNRDNSHDSRYPGVGFVPRDRIRGRVIHVFSFGKLPPELRSDAVRGTALPD